MRDEMFDRDYQNSRADLNAGIDLFARRLWSGFSRLHGLQWQAPWHNGPARHRPRRRSGLA